jgi:hypothetical protein
MTCLVFLPCLACAADEKPPGQPSPQQDSLSSLVDLLAEKGIITGEEQAELKKRAEQARQPAPPPEAPKPAFPTLKVRVNIQPRFSLVSKGTNQPFFGERDDQTGGDGFAVRRARLYFLGQLNPKVGYCLQYQADNGTEDANLHVAQVEWKGWAPLNLVAGQLQTPFGYEIALPDGYLLTIDRSAVSDFLPADKDIGIRLDGKRPLTRNLNYQFFVGNGSTKFKGNPNRGLLWIGRLTAKPTPHLTIGADYSSNRDTDASPYQSRFLNKNKDPYGLLPFYTAADVDETAWSADFQYEHAPVTVWGEYVRARIHPGARPAITADGYYVDAGYFLPYHGRRDKLQFIAGYQQFDPNTAVTDRFDLRATTLGLNYYISGFEHMVKLNYVWMNKEAAPVDNNKLILQYQLWF